MDLFCSAFASEVPRARGDASYATGPSGWQDAQMLLYAVLRSILHYRGRVQALALRAGYRREQLLSFEGEVEVTSTTIAPSIEIHSKPIYIVPPRASPRATALLAT